jgi:LysR family transcriptional regulator, transcription activator of glutamate synthase operon
MQYESMGLAPMLEILVAVADHESMTTAAAQLGMPQPTVSRTIARLEDELGIDITIRHGRGIRMTRQGSALADHGRRALDELRTGIAAAREDVDGEYGRVVLGFLHSMGASAVPSLLRGFRDTHPRVTFGLEQGASEDVIDGVLTGRIDLALASPVPTHADLGVRYLSRQEMVALVHSDHHLAGRPAIRIADLSGEPLITLRRGYGIRTLTDSLLRSAGLSRKYVFESDEVATAAGLVSAGLGVAVLPADTHGPDTVALPIDDTGAARIISLVWSNRRTLSGPVTALRSHLIANVGPAW